jgi:hypothetical protein
MTLYNIETFTPNLVNNSHDLIQDIENKIDYLNLEDNTLKSAHLNANKGDYIRIHSESKEFIGIITGIEPGEYETKITYYPFHSVFDVDVHYVYSQLASKSLENWLKDIITEQFINNADTIQNVFGLAITTSTSTTNALLGLTENIGNLFEIITTAFLNHGVVIDVAINPQTKIINLNIGRNDATKITIEADLPNIIESEFTFKKTSKSYNKLVVYNKDNESETAIFYKHTDDSISKINTDRIAPVIFDTIFVTVSSNQTFDEVAYDTAFTTMTAEKYNNLIELTVTDEDDLVKPYDLKIGQEVDIIYKDTLYSTILTGFEFKETTKIIFGAARTELTKLWKRR